VPSNEVTAPLREVKCRSCGHGFSYGFAPEYVIEAELDPHTRPDPDAPIDRATDTAAARDRLSRHVVRYPEYADRDRDVLLLYQLDLADHFEDELKAIRRVLDVIVKRSSSR